MLPFIAAFLAEQFPGYAALVVARCDVPRALVNGRAQSWRERLNRAAFAARHRVTLESPDIAHARTLRERRTRCEVFAENSGIAGRASFGGAA